MIREAKIREAQVMYERASNTAQKYFDKGFINDKEICPTEDKVIAGMTLGTPSKDDEDRRNDKRATRAWSQIRMNNLNFIGE